MTITVASMPEMLYNAIVRRRYGEEHPAHNRI